MTALLAQNASCASAATFSIKGFSRPFRTIDVAAPESGIITNVYVVDGQYVTNGQALAALDTQALQLNLAIARTRMRAMGRIDSLKAESAFLQRKLAKLRKLALTKAATPDEIDRASADVAIARANLKQAHEARQIHKLECQHLLNRIHRRRISSPINGVVLRTVKDISENVTAADLHIATVAQLNPLLVTGYISPRQARQLKREGPVLVRFTSSKTDTKGCIDFVSPVVDAESGTVEIKILVHNTDGRYKSGEQCLILIAPSDDTTSPRTDQRRSKE